MHEVFQVLTVAAPLVVILTAMGKVLHGPARRLVAAIRRAATFDHLAIGMRQTL